MKRIQALVSIFILMGMLSITPVLPARALPNTRYVATTGNDTGNNCLNQASPCKTIIRAVGQAISGDIIDIAAGTYKESNQVTANKNLTFIGAGMKKTFVDGSTSHRVFKINASIAVTIKNLTIRNGKALNSTGGGINSEGTLDLIKVKIANNTATGAGGGLYVYSGSATLTNTAITKNKAGNGAGIFGRVGDITLNRVEISENTATSYTGGIRYQANGGTLSLTNVTVSSNNGKTIGGISTGSGTTTNIHNSTIVGNHIDPASTYGGISNSGTLTIESSIVANNDKTQCNVPNLTNWVSNGYNIASDDSCDLDGLNDLPPPPSISFGPLGNYGGLTRTHYLPEGNPALENGNNASCPLVDQRGISRPQDYNNTGGAGCDMGAFEATEVPRVYSITRDIPLNRKTNLSEVQFKVIFSETVENVSIDDFKLVKTGSITKFSIKSVNHLGTVTYVTVNTGKYNGTLKLNVKNGTNIQDTIGTPLNSGFTTGEIYTIKKTYTLTSRSQAKYDGWVLESGEFTNKGGIKNNTNKTLLVGDNVKDKQYRVILSFGTAVIPDGAVITRVVLKVKRAGIVGKNPMFTHNGLVVDIKKNKFYTLPALQINDFQAKPGKYKVGVFPKTLYSGQWYRAVLYKGARPYINKKGRTQLRLRYALDDNNDNGADILKLFSGNAILANRPKLIVKYYVP